MTLTYAALRQMVLLHPKYPNTIHIPRAPLIHPGFPGTFNLSFTEEPWIKEYGRFVDFDHDYHFSTIQSCIRPEDMQQLHTKNSWKYLGAFELGDLTGALNFAVKPDWEYLQRHQVYAMVDFLRACEIPAMRIHPSYCAGGTVRRLTNGAHPFDNLISADEITKDAFLDAGVPEENLIPDHTRDTFLSPYIRRASPWGYRSEVNVRVLPSELLDVGTLEYTFLRPTFAGSDKSLKNLNGLRSSVDGFAIAAVGLERLWMAGSHMNRIQDADYLVPLYKSLAGQENVVVGESLRALHRLHADIAHYDLRLSRHHKAKIRALIRNVPPELEVSHLRESLEAHSATQPWHPELAAGIEPTIERIEAYRVATR